MISVEVLMIIVDVIIVWFGMFWWDNWFNFNVFVRVFGDLLVNWNKWCFVEYKVELRVDVVDVRIIKLIKVVVYLILVSLNIVMKGDLLIGNCCYGKMVIIVNNEFV